MTTALLELLRKGDDPSVVVIASIAGVLNQHSMGSLMYGASKVSSRYTPHGLMMPLIVLTVRVQFS